MTGLLFLQSPAIVLVDGTSGQERVQVIDVAHAATFSAAGRFAVELGEFVRARTTGPMLTALAPEQPARRFMLGIGDETARPLDLAGALELDGYDTLFVELVGRCNERCVHCYASASPRVDAELSLATCRALIDDAASLGFRRVQLTGGDPLLCSFVVDLATQVVGHGLECEVYTNGLALDDGMLEGLVDAGAGFAFSFYSHDEATHDAITATPGSHRRTAAAIARAAASAAQVRVAMVVMEQNSADVAATRACVEGLGVEFFSARPSCAVGRGRRHDEVAAADLVPAGASAADPSPRRTMLGKLCVTYDGQVTPCIFNRGDVLGCIDERRLVDIARQPSPPPARGLSASELLAACGDELSCVSCRLTACALQAAAGGVL